MKVTHLLLLALSGVTRAALALDSFSSLNTVLQTCHAISSTVSSSSSVYFPGKHQFAIGSLYVAKLSGIGSPQYDADVAHFANSSAQQSVCSVEPGSNEDVSSIVRILISCSHKEILTTCSIQLKLLGQNRTPFAACLHKFSKSL